MLRQWVPSHYHSACHTDCYANPCPNCAHAHSDAFSNSSPPEPDSPAYHGTYCKTHGPVGLADPCTYSLAYSRTHRTTHRTAFEATFRSTHETAHETTHETAHRTTHETAHRSTNSSTYEATHGTALEATHRAAYKAAHRTPCMWWVAIVLDDCRTNRSGTGVSNLGTGLQRAVVVRIRLVGC
jgi:hypothetical protein